MINGRNLEKVVGFIHHAFKDNESVKIYTNHKLRTLGGSLREFDIIIKTTINNIEICIAIECKDYKRPVPVDKIEAFNSKCCQFMEISKRVFVSSSGYQSGSIETANHFGIELYTLDNLDRELIPNILNLIRIDRQIRINYDISIGIGCTLAELPEVEKSEDLAIYFNDANESPISIYGFLWNNVVVKNQQEISSVMLFNFMKGECRTDKKMHIPFKIKTSNVFIKDRNGKECPVDIINAELICWYDEIPTLVTSASSYQRSNSKSEASVFSINSGKNKFDIVYTNKKNIPTVFIEKDGKPKQLEVLATFVDNNSELIINENNSSYEVDGTAIG